MRSIFQCIYPCVKSVKATRFLDFSLNSKAIVNNIKSTQVTNETNHISLISDSMMSSALNVLFFIYFIVT